MKTLFIIIIGIALIPTTTACKKNTPAPRRHMCAHKEDPSMGQYSVVFTGVTRGFLQMISQEIHGKFFELGEKGEISVTKPKTGAHGFTVVEKNPKGPCIINVTPQRTKDKGMSVNIQMFIKEQGKSRRIFNPGNFNITKMMATSKNNDPALLLSHLIVKLTFK
jgi:hypothetical protein